MRDREVLHQLLKAHGTATIIAAIADYADNASKVTYKDNPGAVIHHNAPLVRKCADAMVGVR